MNSAVAHCPQESDASGEGFRRMHGEVAFSEVAFLSVVAIKGLWDGLWWVPIAKWIYPFFFFFAAFLCFAGAQYDRFRIGRLKQTEKAHGRPAAVQAAIAASSLYVTFVVLLYFLGGQKTGTLEQCFKTIYPFLLFWTVMALPKARLRLAITLYASLVIFGNALTAFFDVGWVNWGGTMTFKGWYFFKTDLAYSAVTALVLLLPMWRGRFAWVMIATATVVLLEVYLANARTNYLLLAIVFVFSLSRLGIRQPRTWVILAGVLGLLATLVTIYRPERMLTFDTTNLESFTQGRNKTWDILIDEGLEQARARELALGGGLNYDSEIISYHADFNERRDAHNEFLHVLITQGVLGTLLYLWAWVSLVFFVEAGNRIRSLRGFAILALCLLWIQGMTDLVSLKATKTWPAAMIMLLVVAENQRRLSAQHQDAALSVAYRSNVRPAAD